MSQIAWPLRRSLHAVWVGPLGVVTTRLVLDPVRYPWYWLALETIKARPATRSIPVLVCPVAGWLLAGREQFLGLQGVYVWPEGFELEDLLGTVQLALAA